MTLWQEYRQPTSLDEAIEDLSKAPQPAIPIAGGTDLLIDIRQGRQSPPETLIDLTGVPEMNVIENRGDHIHIGAAVSINRIVSSPLLQKNAQALIEACDLIAGPQVRNTATLGGNVAHALPAADGTIALVSLDARAEIVNPQGIRDVPFVELFKGPGKSAIDKSQELIVGFNLPIIEDNQGSAFKRIMRPQGVALPILNCAVWVDRDGDNINNVRIAVGPGGPTPFRAIKAEEVLQGQTYHQKVLKKALEHLISQARFRTSPHRATEDYRKYIIHGLFEDTFMEAWKRAQ